jgi:hypothetical protein
VAIWPEWSHQLVHARHPFWICGAPPEIQSSELNAHDYFQALRLAH